MKKDFVDNWRDELKSTFGLFARLKAEDLTLDIEYGIVAGAIVWPVRSQDDDQKAALIRVCGDDHFDTLLSILKPMQFMQPLQAAQYLAGEATTNTDLKIALDALLEYFRKECLEFHILQPARIDIQTGDVIGGNIVIGGSQYVAGDLLIRYITVQQKVRVCPTAPSPPTHFSGRREELDHLQQTLSQGQSIAITGVQGMGGIGKTALALQLATEMTGFSATLWTSLGPQPTAITHLVNWARHADPDFDPSQDDVETIVSRVHALLTNLIDEMCPGQVLVILDDIWEESVSIARLLQKAAPANSVLLITTRSQRVVAQMRSTRLELKPMQPQEALQMLRKLLSDYQAITDDTLIDLAETVGFHPLAMELAAGQVTLLERPVQDIGGLIEQYKGGIPAGSPFRDIDLELGEDREDNLELVLSFSYASLNKEDQACFRQLGVLAYGAVFNRSMVEAIWESMPKPHLDSLRHHSLIAIGETEGWYTQHPLLRSYARILLDANAETDVVFNRYADSIIGFTDTFALVPPETWKTFDNYIPHVFEIGDTLAKHYSTEAVPEKKLIQQAETFVLRTARYLRIRRNIHRSEWLDMGLSASKQTGNTLNTSVFLNELGLYNSLIGNNSQALKFFEESLAFSRSIDNFSGQAITLINLGALYNSLGNRKRAINYLHDALSICRRINDLPIEASNLNALGAVHEAVSRYQEALDYFQEALALRRMVKDKSGEATVLGNIGSVLDALGNKQEALNQYRKALDIQREVGDLVGEATSLNSIGGIYADLGDRQRALSHYEQVLMIRHQTGNRAGEATTLNSIGTIYHNQSKSKSAINYYTQALAIRRDVGDTPGEAVTLSNIGASYEALGDNQQALEFYAQTLELRRSVSDRSGEADTLNNIGAVYDNLDKREEALEYYQQALKIQRSLGRRQTEATTLNNMGHIYFREGKLPEALEYLTQAIEIVNDIGMPSEEATFLFNRAAVLESMGRLSEAIADIEESMMIMRRNDLTVDNAGYTLEMRETLLKHLRSSSKSGPSPQSLDERQILDELLGYYETLGKDQMRKILTTQGLPPNVVKKMLHKLESEAAKPLLPEEQIKWIVEKTIKALTTDTVNRIEWRLELRFMQASWKLMEYDLQQEDDFAQAIMSRLEGSAFTLPKNNPYAPYFQQIIDATEKEINEFENTSETDEIADDLDDLLSLDWQTKKRNPRRSTWTPPTDSDAKT